MLTDRAIPLYYQIETILRKKMSSGELVPGDPLPTELSLADEYGVSRITIRQALSSLERDGLIVRKRGTRTVVSKGRIYFDPLKYTGSIEDLIIMGIKNHTKVLNFYETQIPDRIAKFIPLPQNMEAICIERLRLAEDRPYCYVSNYLPTQIGKRIHPDTLLKKPLLKILEDDLGLTIANAVQTYEATIADPQMAPLLNVRVGQPLLKIQRAIFDSNQAFVEYVSIYYRADKCLFKVELQREKKGDAITWALSE